ncbi:MAG: 7-cyano-7-deazaguanine synthase [Nitrososphaeraceae archaeon]
MKDDNIIVSIISGGLDSICTTAYYLKNKGKNNDLYTISFIYGQRAIIEIEHAKRFSDFLGSKDHYIVDISFMKKIYGKTNVLTNSNKKIPSDFDYTIVVPIRNAIFITIATSWAMSIGATTVLYGAHKNDNNYPDCRPEFTKALSEVLNLGEIDGIRSGLRKRMNIWSPALDGLDKSDLIKIGYKILGNKIFDTWSCYYNGKTNKEEKGIHCGICESCINRRIAIKNAGIDDKTKYVN